MENVKRIFGFLMIAVALFLLDRILSPLLSLIFWALLLTYAPIKLGIFKNLTRSIKLWDLLFKLSGLIIFIYGILLWALVAKGGGDIQQPIDSIIYGENISSSKSIEFETVLNEAQLNAEIAKTKKASFSLSFKNKNI